AAVSAVSTATTTPAASLIGPRERALGGGAGRSTLDMTPMMQSRHNQRQTGYPSSQRGRSSSSRGAAWGGRSAASAGASPCRRDRFVGRSRSLASTTATYGMTVIPTAHRTSHNHSSGGRVRSEEHTSELQSRENLVCRLLLEKKKQGKEENHCT